MIENPIKNCKPTLVFMAGASGSGKTTVVAKLLPVLRQKGLKVGVIKHATHIELAKDKDSSLYLASGAEPVTVVSSHNMLLMSAPKAEMSLEDVAVAYYQNPAIDLIIVEGYKNTKLPKVEVLRKGVNDKLYAKPEDLLCVVTDMPEAVPDFVPALSFEQQDQLADLVYNWYLNFKL